jgi:hypothetical protein
MTMEKRYKIVNESTTGWVLIDNEAQNLTKEQCDKWIDDLLVRGANPNYFKVALQNDPNYPTE